MNNSKTGILSIILKIVIVLFILGGAGAAYIFLKNTNTDINTTTDTNRAINTNTNSFKIFPVADGDVYEYSYRNWNNTNWGAHTGMGAGWNPTGGSRRMYIRFDLTNVTTISQAVLTFPQLSVTNTPLEYGIFLITSPWEEGTGVYNSDEVEENAAPGELSWNQQPTFELVPATTFDMSSASGAPFEIDITTLVQEWLRGSVNYGLMIGVNGDPTIEGSIASPTVEAQDQTTHPYLSITQ